MPQIIAVSTRGQPLSLPTNALADLDGLSIQILTGSGILLVSYSLHAINTLNSLNSADIQFTLDGVPLSKTWRSWLFIANGWFTLASAHLIQPGAGKHIITLQGVAGAADIQISNITTEMIVHEPGFKP